ncbi:Purine-binding protein precursor [Variovorax sp. PBS-H4]|uniref:BMP family ABC transporter substrate-binding protein n=1 Tax=Variovorax sp. PBS-H4 TaxID=434008 RepID=UPI001319B170|nr:BMP family ABC transporter substrate-binding protein [Variovorax sp. PBS-H4]VTU38830.1 Purine-binding protein precursor [Variovorax sp. PBS-H4]
MPLHSPARVLFAGVFAACTSLAAAAADPLEIGFVYQSPVSDVGWVAVHESARKQLEKEFGSRIKTRVVQDVKVGPDGARVMRELVGGGAGLVVLGSFGYMNDGLKLAAEEPKVNFIHASGFKQAPNFGTYNARWYEGAYVAGLVAGKVTKSNKLGYVGAIPIPDVVSTINAFALGVKRSNPAATVSVVWVNEWFNPGSERDAANSLIQQGADVIGSGFQDNPAIVQAADARGVWSVGMFSDLRKAAPNKLLTSITHDWTPHFRQVVADTLAGKFKGAAYVGTLQNGGVNLLDWNAAVPPEVVKMAKAAQADIAAGKLNPFAGPLKDNTGKVRAAPGAAVPDAEIAGMNWFVEGIQGAMPR